MATVPVRSRPDACTMTTDDIKSTTLCESQVRRTRFLVGVRFLFRDTSHTRFMSECNKISAVMHVFLNHEGDEETVVEVQRSAGTPAQLGLNMVTYWKHSLDSEWSLWFVVASE